MLTNSHPRISNYVSSLKINLFEIHIDKSNNGDAWHSPTTKTSDTLSWQITERWGNFYVHWVYKTVKRFCFTQSI